jgi:hypothetical protein
MAVNSNLEATLKSGKSTVLTRVHFGRCRLTITGIAGEFTTIPFQTRTRGGLKVSEFFRAKEVSLNFFDTFPSATIVAQPPDGVGSLDIIYEVRTGADAA